jgi:S1-C subfamily serine protease
VAFCIQCGVQNETNAVFCAACGQILYHEHPNPTPPRVGAGRRKWLIIACLLLVLAAVIVVLFAPKSEKVVQRAEVSSPPEEPVGAPVLTLIASGRSGSAVSQGSGFIITSDGLAGSNYHVIRGAVQAVAECCNGRIFEVRSIEGVDLEKDLVVFQLYERGSTQKPQDLPHVTLGSSKDVTVGQKVIAIGSPQGLENTVSDGILSAVREYKSTRYLQITAPISPGSSGGPVLNEKGKMVGVATFQFETGQNLNFAVDAEHIRPLIDEHFGFSLTAFQSTFGKSNQKKSRTVNSEANHDDSSYEQHKVSPLTGQFGGIVHNQSANLSAEFVILVRDDEGLLSGCMGVKEPLFGSGPLSGVVDDNDVYFIVTSSIGKIEFTGKRKGGSVTGAYLVRHESRPDESGSFTLQKANSKGPDSKFDTANCPTDAEIHN